MAGPRDPRNFLYDDYYEAEHDADERSDDYEAPRGRGAREVGRSAGDRGRPVRRYEDDDMDVEYERPERRRVEVGGSRGSGLAARRPVYERPVERPAERAAVAGGGRQARRFADAMGIPPSRATYADEEDYGVPVRSRVQRALYREPAIARVAPVRGRVVRRRYDDYDDDVDLPRGARVVEVVERVRRVPVVKKIPIRQRVVKKIIVEKVGGPVNRRRSNDGNDRVRRVQKGGVQKKKAVGGGGGGGAGPSGEGGAKGGRFKNQKPKMSASELDRELEEYMRGSKHPRVTT